VGRSEAKLLKIIGDLERINPQGSYVPIRAEISLLKNVDAACEEYKRKEKRLDLLFLHDLNQLKRAKAKSIKV